MTRDPRTDSHETPLDPRDARFVARVRDAYDPGPLVPARRAAFDEALRERLAARPRWSAWPVFAGGLAAAALAALVVLRAPEPERPAPSSAPQVAVRTTPEVAPPAAEPGAARPVPTAWARTLLLAEENAGAVDTDPRENLPPTYAAVAGLFLDR